MKTIDLQDHMSHLVREARDLVEHLPDEVNTKNVHKLRVCVRRLRTMLSLIPDSLSPESAKMLKRLWRRLGEVRDLDVAKMFSEEFGLPVHGVKKERRKKREELLQLLKGKSVSRLLDEMEKVSLRKESTQLNPAPAARALRMKLLLTPATSIHLHDLRIILKKIRYLREALNLPIDDFRGYQDRLGEYQDIDVFLQRFPDEEVVQEEHERRRDAALIVLRDVFALGVRSLGEIEKEFGDVPERKAAS